MIARSKCFLEIYFVTVIPRKRFRMRNGYFNYAHFGVALVYVVVVVHRKLLFEKFTQLGVRSFQRMTE